MSKIGFLACLLSVATQPNVLVINIDDIGWDLMDNACTPELDAFASESVVFDNYWTNPMCSPTRAQLLTGRHAWRTGIGEIVNQNGTHIGLSLAETTLPEALGCDSLAVGKWHLGDPSQGADHPTDSGFGGFSGGMYNPGWQGFSVVTGCESGNGYSQWVKVLNGVESCETQYMSSHTADQAILGMSRLREPWLIYASFNAVHKPEHCPPGSLWSCGFCQTPGAPPEQEAMLEALDTELGRVLTMVDDDDTWVFIVSDNGTAPDVYGDDQAKGTLYQGGVNVPALVRGPGITISPGERDILASSVDVYATVLDLWGLTPAADVDGVSWLSWLQGGSDPRDYVYAERFEPNGCPLDADFWDQAVRNDTHKLIRRGTEEEFYDLISDPEETNPLPLGGSIYTELSDYLDGISPGC